MNGCKMGWVSQVRARKTIFACGVVVVLAVAGCGASGSSVAARSAPAATKASPPPVWARALGPGVEITGPPSAGPAQDTPAAAVVGYIHQLAAPNPGGACLYWIPTDLANCQSFMSTEDEQGYGVKYQSFGTGYTAIYSDLALVVITHTHLCQPKTCTPDNTNPAALLDSGKSFAALWVQAIKPEASDSDLIPCIQGDGVWYIDYAQ
jgi:hypothetical protein